MLLFMKIQYELFNRGEGGAFTEAGLFLIMKLHELCGAFAALESPGHAWSRAPVKLSSTCDEGKQLQWEFCSGSSFFSAVL